MPPARVISMAAYNSSANPCFHSHASVALRSGGFCQMRHLKPGNQIRLSNLYNEKEMSASYATIQGIVETVQPCGFSGAKVISLFCCFQLTLRPWTLHHG